MNPGLDTNVDCSGIAAKIKGAGYVFVCRYYCAANRSKIITLDEARALSKAGLFIVAVWENGYPTSASYFSLQKGREDGKLAYDYARLTIGQPSGKPIYFAVDYDALPRDVKGPINDYFKGIASVFDSSQKAGGPSYPIGVYGSGFTCEWLLSKNQAVKYAWLSMSTGWRGSKTFNGWHLKQSGSLQLEGINFDKDVSKGGGGGFQIK